MNRIERHGKCVVVGQGYVGLPLAMAACDHGWEVVGYDISEKRVSSLNEGNSFAPDVASTELSAFIDQGSYRASTDASAIANFDVCVITVPTPLKDSLPDVSFIHAAAIAIAPHLRAGCLVILESTTHPGTTEDLLVPTLESGSGLLAGNDFFVGYSPERIDPGNKTWTLRTTPKIASGYTDVCLAKVVDFYRPLVDSLVPVNSCKVAELAKLLENTFRHVNIAMVNELAIFAHELGIDVWEAIDAASSKPFGFMKFTPGPGVGGHCLPIDPTYLSWLVRRQLGKRFRFVDLANDLNQQMPGYIVDRIMAGLNRNRQAVNGSKLLVFGVSYKKDNPDTRESPALEVVDKLVELGASVTIFDSFVEPDSLPHLNVLSDFQALTETSLAEYHGCVILTDHSNIDYANLSKSAVYIFDSRHCCPESPVVEFL